MPLGTCSVYVKLSELGGELSILDLVGTEGWAEKDLIAFKSAQQVCQVWTVPCLPACRCHRGQPANLQTCANAWLQSMSGTRLPVFNLHACGRSMCVCEKGGNVYIVCIS